MIVDSSNFQGAIINRSKKSDSMYSCQINNQIIISKESKLLLGVKVDNILNFKKPLSKFRKSTRNKVNAINRTQKN